MQTRQVGSSDIRVTLLSASCATLAAPGIAGARLVAAALDAGVRCFVTADSQGRGGVERLLGRELAGARDEVVLVGAFGYDFYAPEHGGSRAQDWTPGYARYALEASLERLRVAHLDLWLLHDPPAEAIASDALWDAVVQAKSDGLVRALGVALAPGSEHVGVTALNERPLDAIACDHGLLGARAPAELLATARARGASLLAREPALDGAQLRRGLEQTGALAAIAGERTLAELSLAWLAHDPLVASALVGLHDAERIRELARCTAGEPLSAADADRIAALSGA